MIPPRTAWFRKPSEDGHQQVTFAELFFDLVFVFAITQLSHRLLGHLTPLGFAETMILFFATWWVWIYTSWATNWLDPDRSPVRLMLLALTLAGLALSTSIPDAFDKTGLAFALAYVAMQVGRTALTAWALAPVDEANHRNFVRITVWLLLSSLFWLIGGIADDRHQRLAWWALAVGIDYAAPAVNFAFPGLGRSATSDWQVSGGHMAERCGLFVIIALGEAIVVTGTTFSGLPANGETIAAFVAGFIGSAAMWWIYFDRGSKRGSHRITHSDDPGSIARIAYTYGHMPIIAGIVVIAVADEMMLSHPYGLASGAFLLTMLGGPALYVAGTMAFKWGIAGGGRPPLSHLVGLALFALIAILAPRFTPLGIGIAASLSLVTVAAWERRSLGPIEPELEG